MAELTEAQKRKVKKLAQYVEGGELAVLEHLFELSEEIDEKLKTLEERVEEKVESLKQAVEPNLNDILEQVKGKDSKPEDVANVLINNSEFIVLVRPKDGENGKDYILTESDKAEIAKKIDVPVVEKVIEKTEVIHEQPIVTQEVKEVAIAETPEQIREKLKSLKDDERLPKEAIKGLEDIEKDIELLKKKGNQMPQGGVASRDYFVDIDLTDQLDGSTKTFNIQAIRKILSVNLQSYPYGALRKGIDYTYTNTTITFTDTIDASTQLAEGQVCIITATIS